MELDAIDRRILDLLQNDGRISNADLAENIHLSPSACLRRVKRLEESGIIESYAMLLNPAKIGRKSTIFVEISLNSQSETSLEAFETAVAECADVMDCYLMSGDYDYLLRISAAHAEDYEQIHKNQLSRLPGVSSIRSSFALRAVCKRTHFNLS